MLKVGMQSGYVFRDHDPETALRLIREAGFDCIDYNKAGSGAPEGIFRRSDADFLAYYAPYRAAIETVGVPVMQMHAPTPDYVDGKVVLDDALLESIRKCLLLCGYLDCPYLIVHPLKLPHDPTGETEWETNLAFFKQWIPYAKENGVKICLENLPVPGGRVTESVCSEPRMAAAYIDTLNDLAGEERFAFCFDLGHAALLGKNVRRFLNTMGRRVQTLHLHENDGRQDLHLQPFAYKRADYVADWDGLIAGLRDIGYRGVVSFECVCSMRTLPGDLRAAMAKYIASVGRYLAQNIEQENEPC